MQLRVVARALDDSVPEQPEFLIESEIGRFWLQVAAWGSVLFAGG